MVDMYVCLQGAGITLCGIEKEPDQVGGPAEGAYR